MGFNSGFKGLKSQQLYVRQRKDFFRLHPISLIELYDYINHRLIKMQFIYKNIIIIIPFLKMSTQYALCVVLDSTCL